MISRSRKIDLNSPSFIAELMVDLNATMRRIDLFCKLAGPLFVSLLTIASSPFAALLLAASNVVSLPFEYVFILVVHNRFPDLAIKPLPSQTSPLIRRIVEWPKRTLHSWIVYYNSPLFLASFALCILYFTVLSFGGMTLICSTYARFHDRLLISIFRVSDSPYCWSSGHSGNNGHRGNLRLSSHNSSSRFS